MHRRKFLKIAGSGGVILAAAGAGGFLATRSPVAAQQPWNQATAEYADPMRRALAYAILAPNPHNRQPWVVDLQSETEALLTCDLQRRLPQTDPFDRQIVIGLGCFLELFALAARQDGYRAEIDLFPQGSADESLDQRAVAGLRLVADAQLKADPLFAGVLRRRTNRNAYDLTRPIAAHDLELITSVAESKVIAGSLGQGETLGALRTLTRDALRDEILDPQAFGESIDLMRIGRAEIEASPDGISVAGPLMETLSLFGLISREDMRDPASQSFQVGLDMADDQALTAMGFVWINTRGNSRIAQIDAGRAYLRIALAVTGLGLSMQPMSQALQEYDAMQAHYQKLHALLTGGGDERVQMLARLGYAKTVEPAPRWAMTTRIKPA